MGQFRRELFGFFLVVAAAYALIALYGGEAGEAGRALARWLTRALGAVSGLAAVLAALVGLQVLLRPGALRGLQRLVAAVLLVAAAASAAELVKGLWDGASGGLSASLRQGGGWLGATVAVWMGRALGRAGTALAVAAAFLLAVSLAMDVGPVRLLSWPVGVAGRGMCRSGGALVRWVRAGAGGAARLAALGAGVLGRRRRPARPSVDPAAQATPVPGADRARALPPRGGSGEVALPPAEPAAAATIASSPHPAPPAPSAGTGAESSGASREGPGKAAPSTGGAPGGRSLAKPSAPPAGSWRLPPTGLLTRPPARRRPTDDPEAQERSRLLERTLASFGIEARVVHHTRGPVVTRYELTLPPGVKLSRVVSLADDLSLALATTGVRIEAPVPGKPVVGIEVPNGHVETVYLREVIESPAFARSPAPLALALGRDVGGEPVVADLERLIHLLIAGATGSGKSVCLASIIVSLLYRLTPQQLRLLLIDPKRVELTVYEGIPHLLAPVVTEARQAASALSWAVEEMEARYQQLARAGARHLAAYNQMAARGQVEEPLPYVVVVVDELADLMMVAPAEVEDSICRLAQMARAAGIHLVIATQRPSTDVITGLIKANIPSRLAFAVSSQVDSRTILDTGGAERLLGRGDMLYHPLGEPKPIRAQGCLVTDQDVEQVVGFWTAQGGPDYRVDVFAEREAASASVSEDDDLYDEAVRLVAEAGQASVSMLQRRFRIGYARAARLIDLMEQRGVVGPYQGSKPRDVLPPYRQRPHSA